MRGSFTPDWPTLTGSRWIAAPICVAARSIWDRPAAAWLAAPTRVTGVARDSTRMTTTTSPTRPPRQFGKQISARRFRGAPIADADFYLVDLHSARYDPEQAAHFRRCDAILVDRTT